MEEKIKKIENMVKMIEQDIADAKHNLEFATRHNDMQFMSDSVNCMITYEYAKNRLNEALAILKE